MENVTKANQILLQVWGFGNVWKPNSTENDPHGKHTFLEPLRIDVLPSNRLSSFSKRTPITSNPLKANRCMRTTVFMFSFRGPAFLTGCPVLYHSFLSLFLPLGPFNSHFALIQLVRQLTTKISGQIFIYLCYNANKDFDTIRFVFFVWWRKRQKKSLRQLGKTSITTNKYSQIASNGHDDCLRLCFLCFVCVITRMNKLIGSDKISR